jgi:hypothetical protein
VILTTESLGYYELKQHKIWLDKECSKLLEQRKQAKKQCLQHPSHTNGDNNNVKCETSRNFRNKKREYIKEKIKKQNENIRYIYKE